MYISILTFVYIGAIPSEICRIPGLTRLFVLSNNGITCAPSCLSTVPSKTLPSTTCPSIQDIGLCGMIAATNIHAQSGYSQWNCTTLGKTVTNPCTAPVWNGLACGGNNVTSIVIVSVGLTGTYFCY